MTYSYGLNTADAGNDDGDDGEEAHSELEDRSNIKK